MKTSVKLLAITAIVAVIVFSFIGCEEPTTDTLTVTLTGITAEP